MLSFIGTADLVSYTNYSTDHPEEEVIVLDTFHRAPKGRFHSLPSLHPLSGHNSRVKGNFNLGVLIESRSSPDKSTANFGGQETAAVDRNVGIENSPRYLLGTLNICCLKVITYVILNKVDNRNLS